MTLAGALVVGLGIAIGTLGGSISYITEMLSEMGRRSILNKEFECPYCNHKFKLQLINEHINMDHQDDIRNQEAVERVEVEAGVEGAAAPVVPPEKIKMD